MFRQYGRFSKCPLWFVHMQSLVQISAFIRSCLSSCTPCPGTDTDSGAPDSPNRHTVPPCRCLSGTPSVLQMSHRVFSLWLFDVGLLLSCCLSSKRHKESRRQAYPVEIMQWAIHYHPVFWLQHAFMALSVMHIYKLCMWLSNLASSRKQCSIR